MTFEDLELHPRILAGLGNLAGQPLTTLQQQALPAIMEGQDVLVLAAAGDGKTTTFVIPLLQHALFGPRGRIQGLILTLTPERASAIHQELERLGQYTRLRSLALCNGQPTAQLEVLRSGVEIMVACPGTLVELLNRGMVELSRVGMLVLEELDRLCDMGLLPELWRILKALPQEHQTLLFSATDNDELRTLSRNLLRAPVTIQLDTAAAPPVAHILYPVEAESKAEALLTLLDAEEVPSQGLLIFCETRFRAKRLETKLKRAGYAPAALTEDLSTKRRNMAIEGFRNGVFGMLVTTDAGVQGFHVTGVAYVINFDMPTVAATYFHRVGRVAHEHRQGVVLSLVTADDAEIVEALSQQLETPPEQRLLP